MMMFSNKWCCDSVTFDLLFAILETHARVNARLALFFFRQLEGRRKENKSLIFVLRSCWHYSNKRELSASLHWKLALLAPAMPCPSGTITRHHALSDDAPKHHQSTMHCWPQRLQYQLCRDPPSSSQAEEISALLPWCRVASSFLQLLL